MRRITAFLLALAICLGAGCASGGGTVSVCRVLAEEYQTDGRLVEYERVAVREGETELDAAVRALNGGAESARLTNPVSGPGILSCTVSDGTAVVELGGDYARLGGMDQTLIEACCTLTLCALEDVERVSIYCSGKAVAVALTADDMMTEGADTEFYRRELFLYYSDGENLVADRRSLSVYGSEQAERFAVEELLRAPEGLNSVIPEGTGLLGVTRKGRACTINLSSDFLEKRADTATGQFMAAAALVSSLASLGGISEVLINVDGETAGDYGPLNLSEPLAAFSFICAPEDWEETAAGRLYFEWDGALFGAPCLLPVHDGAEQAVLDALSSAESFGSCRALFSPADELTHAGTENGVCTVTVSRGFFESRMGAELDLALDALTLSLLNLDSVNSVRLRYADGEVPVTPGRDLSVPLIQIKSSIIQ